MRRFPVARAPMFRVAGGMAGGLGDLGFSLNPASVAKRHISMIRAMVKRHVSIARKAATRHVGLVRRPFNDIRNMRTGSPQSRPGAVAAPDVTQYTDANGNPIPASDLWRYQDANGQPLGPTPAGFDESQYYGTPYDASNDPAYNPDYNPANDPLYASTPPASTVDPRTLLTLPAARIRELADAGALYPGSGPTTQALLDRERSLYQSPAYQPSVSYQDAQFPSYEPAPDRTVYGVEHTPSDYAMLAPPYQGPESPHAPWMSETAETAWSGRDAVYPAASSSSDEWGANVGPSFAEDAYGADALSGIYDVLIGDPLAFWSQKWQDAKAKLTAALVSISGTSETLATIRSQVDSAIDATANNTTLSADDIAALERARQKLVTLENNQADLEGRAKDAALQMKQTADANPDSGLGVFPIVAVGVIIAAVVAIVAAVIVHTQNVNALANEVSAIVAGKISAVDIAKIQGGGGPPGIIPGFSLPDVAGAASSLTVLAVVAVAAYLLLNRKR